MKKGKILRLVNFYNITLHLAGVFHDTFKRLNVVPEVIYPSLNTDTFDKELHQNQTLRSDEHESTMFSLLSINRYERKKNLPLALKTLGKF